MKTVTSILCALTGLATAIATLSAGAASVPIANATVIAGQPQQEEPKSQPIPKAPGSSMTVEGLDAIIKKIDPEAERNENLWQFTVVERQVYVVADPSADRMRIMSPIAQASSITPELYARMMQANFDAALDARYAVAQDLVWSVFIHPLGSLTERELLSGTAQTVTAAVNYGTSFSSGALVYGGGDTNGIIGRQLLDELLKKEGQPM